MVTILAPIAAIQLACLFLQFKTHNNWFLLPNLSLMAVVWMYNLEVFV